MNIKISWVLLSGLLVNISQQFFAALQKDQGAITPKVKVVSFADVPNAARSTSLQKEIDSAVESLRKHMKQSLITPEQRKIERYNAILAGACALQRVTQEQGITEVENWYSRNYTFIVRGNKRIIINDDIFYEMEKIIFEDYNRCCSCWPGSWVFPKDVNLQHVLNRVKVKATQELEKLGVSMDTSAR